MGIDGTRAIHLRVKFETAEVAAFAKKPLRGLGVLRGSVNV